MAVNDRINFFNFLLGAKQDANKIISTGKDLTIKNATVCENNENGICVIDYWIGNILIQNCHVQGNKEFGIVLSQDEKQNAGTHLYSTSTSANNTSTFLQNLKARVMECDIKNNQRAGVYVCHQHTQIVFSTIKENGQLAINLRTSDNQKFISFYKNTRSAKSISGGKGGSWGEYKGAPQAKTCFCFGRNKKEKTNYSTPEIRSSGKGNINTQVNTHAHSNANPQQIHSNQRELELNKKPNQENQNQNIAHPKYNKVKNKKYTTKIILFPPFYSFTNLILSAILAFNS